MVNLFFYLMAAGTVCAALGVVLARNPVRSVIALLGSFFCLSVIYLLAGFQFLAAIQILVYGGAVMVLFLFVVMLLNLGDPAEAESHEEPLFHRDKRAMIGIGVAVALCAGGLGAVLRASLAGEPALLAATPMPTPETGFDPVLGIAEQMFTRYSLPFEAASVLLLATAVGVMVIAKRQRPGIQSGSQGEEQARAAGSARARVAARDGGTGQ
ncbi:MAG: NADH-quinone oxidoreductase subunit J [bacterium]|nr:NADH-quinone oxidoreductase subunit J [bacterium]